MAEAILEIRNLRTYFYLDEGTLKAIDDVSFAIHRHEILGLIGESGCGKSVTAQSILRIVPKPGKQWRELSISGGIAVKSSIL